MDISEVAKASGIPASALRYYEEKALIQSTGRIGIRRQFAASVLTRLALITLGQQAGFSLEDIAVMLNTAEEQINREKLLEKASDIEQQIRELGAIRDALLHAAACPAEHHLDCPKFQQLLHIAGKRRVRGIGRSGK